MNVEQLSEDLLLFTLGGPLELRSLDSAQLLELKLTDSNPHWLVDFRFGFGQFLIQYRPMLIDADQLRSQVETWLAEERLTRGQDKQIVLEIPVCYHPEVAPDLATVARSTGLSVNQVVELHTAPTYRVLATGFSPGFGYLGETDERLHLPRKQVPLTRIPPGSVAIAENQSVIYPNETPGGWHLIGRTAFELVSISQEQIKVQLSLGRSVRFVPISLEQYQQQAGQHA